MFGFGNIVQASHRHCERGEAIQSPTAQTSANGPGLPRRFAPRNDEGL
jgi:hypothetical protein